MLCIVYSMLSKRDNRVARNPPQLVICRGEAGRDGQSFGRVRISSTQLITLQLYLVGWAGWLATRHKPSFGMARRTGLSFEWFKKLSTQSVYLERWGRPSRRTSPILTTLSLYLQNPQHPLSECFSFTISQKCTILIIFSLYFFILLF